MSHDRPRSPFERLEQGRLAHVLGLSPDQIDNLANLVLLHVLLDTALSSLMSVHLAPEAVDSVVEHVAGISFDRRLKVLHGAGLLAKPDADAIGRVNAARNQMLHFKPGRRLSEVEAIRSNAEFDRLYADGITALRNLYDQKS